MAWSDNVRCLYCDGKLPLYRKITNGQFCSALHHKAYWQDQERLAVERLHQTHDSLRAYRSPEALEAILGKPAASEPVGLEKYYVPEQAPEVETKLIQKVTSKLNPQVESKRNAEVESKLDSDEIARSASNTGNVKFPGFLTEEKPALRAWEALLAGWDVEFAQWPMSAPWLPSSALKRDEEQTLPTANGIAVPLFAAIGLAAEIRAAAGQAAPVAFIGKLISQVRFAFAPQTEELSDAFLASLKAAKVVAAPVAQPASQVEAPVEETPLPFAERLAALPKISSRSAPLVLRGRAPEPQQTIRASQNARYDAAFASPAVAAVTRLEPLAMTNAPRALAATAGAAGDAKTGDLQGYLEPLELNNATGTPWLKFALSAPIPEMQLASGSGDSVLNRAGAAPANLNAASAPSVEALEVGSEASRPSLSLVSPALDLSLPAARGCRYDVQSQPGPIQHTARSAAADEILIVPVLAKQLSTQSLDLGPGIAGPCDYPLQSAAAKTLPVVSAEPLVAKSHPQIVALPDGLGKKALHPALVGVRPLAFTATPCAPSAPQPDRTGVANIYAANTPMNPAAKWEPLDGSATPLRHGFLSWTQTFAGAQDGKHAWTLAADFWQRAPRDLKLLAIAIPILLGLALRPSLPKVRVTAPASTEGISKNLGDGLRQQFVNVRNTVSQRAAVSLNEDFRSGLDDWQTRSVVSTGWSFDANGFVKPGTLALYRPSLGLGDYDMEFLGLIDKKALSWVVRAKDFDNYYVVKLVVTKPGPLPTIGITRYAVIDGKAQPSVDTIAAINARPDVLYRVSMDVHDDTFLLSLQGNVVDNWTEPRLKTGGVGFFASRGEESRLRWLQVTHQYDMLGRLCAYLAPYNIPTTNGSW
ncbi:MAG: hypothetical protein ABI833_06720 [Acidobacteriota bacterium]